MVPVVMCGCGCGEGVPVPGHYDPRHQPIRHHKGAGIEKIRANDNKIRDNDQNDIKARMTSQR